MQFFQLTEGLYWINHHNHTTDMALQGITTYFETCSLFIAHWTAVNADLAAPLILRDGSTLADLTALLGDIDAALTDVQSRLNDKEIARANVELAKAPLLDRAQEFARKLRGSLQPGDGLIKGLPEMPLQSSKEGVFLDPMRDVATLWEKANASGTLYILSGAYTRVDFEADLDALKDLFNTLATASIDLGLSRDPATQPWQKSAPCSAATAPAWKVPSLPDSPFVSTIPRLSPLPGHTPAPVVLSATYDAVTNEAVFTFTASADPDLLEYEARFVPGPEYDAEDESVLVNIPAGGTREFRTSASLGSPGMALSVRVYTILDTGNESGSNTATVTRPG